MPLREINIERYRGIELFEWHPAPGINCLIGPGDVGKTTILSAISLLLSPRPNPAVSEYDYYRRSVDKGFTITAVIGDLDDGVVGALRIPALQGWKDGKLLPLPDEDGAEPVLVVRVAGSPELEVSHELIAPSGEGLPFPVSVRRRLLLTQIAAEARAMVELRLGRGTLLDRHMGGADLRGAISDAVATASDKLELPPDATKALEALRTLFAKAGLPSDLQLGLITPQERSLIGLLGLLCGATVKEAIPLAFAGTGTTQLALFQLALAAIGKNPIVVLDEPETGLEPYRQRRLIEDLRSLVGEHGQAFLTTHSPAVLEVLHGHEVTRVIPGGQTAVLDQPCLDWLLREHPDTFLSRLPVLCEGPTEAGLLLEMVSVLSREEGTASLDTHGIRLVPRNGQPHILDEAEGLLAAGIECGVFVDAEDSHSGKRARLKSNPRCAFGTWEGVRNIEEAVAEWLPFPQLARVVQVAADVNERQEDSLLQQVGQAAGLPGTRPLAQLAEEVGEDIVRRSIGAAMQAKGRAWFKSHEGGKALGSLLAELGVPDKIDRVVRNFWQEIKRVAVNA